MNERIKQLSIKAGFPEWSNHAIEFELEKFAELIVQDCIKIVEGYCATTPEIFGLPLDILEHFDMELPEEDFDD